jgi:hypothetical protein
MEAQQAHFTNCCECQFLGKVETTCTRRICDWCETCEGRLYSFPRGDNEAPFDLCPDCLIELQNALIGNKLSILDQGPQPVVEPPPLTKSRKPISK